MNIINLEHLLIYPYWNVNFYHRLMCEFYPQPFNLSILECKCLRFDSIGNWISLLIYPYWNVNWWYLKSFLAVLPLLIYPYWNVNFCYTFSLSDSEHLLIYPYWNVNRTITNYWQIRFLSFNLSILECKSFSLFQHIVKQRLLIYPYWNVNTIPKTYDFS